MSEYMLLVLLSRFEILLSLLQVQQKNEIFDTIYKIKLTCLINNGNSQQFCTTKSFTIKLVYMKKKNYFVVSCWVGKSNPLIQLLLAVLNLANTCSSFVNKIFWSSYTYIVPNICKRTKKKVVTKNAVVIVLTLSVPFQQFLDFWDNWNKVYFVDLHH